LESANVSLQDKSFPILTRLKFDFLELKEYISSTFLLLGSHKKANERMGWPLTSTALQKTHFSSFFRLPGLEQFTRVNQLLTNPHAPGSCRTNQVMQNIPSFGKDFGCRKGSTMYPIPDRRCKVWVGH
uniref:Peptidase_M13 domain-containing protein n=1 Tax=Angiostrongylus cantonensis TaxID=6313 RepID=A0A0K0D2E0_ANGCA